MPFQLPNIAVYMANSVDPNQTPHSAASDLDLHCLQRLAFLILRVNMVLVVNMVFTVTMVLLQIHIYGNCRIYY